MDKEEQKKRTETFTRNQDREEYRNLVLNSSKEYVKKEDAYKEQLDSGVMFIMFGIIGEIYLTLCQIHILPLNYDFFMAIVLGGMFAAFIVGGIISILKSKKTKSQISEEKKEEDIIKEWLNQNITDVWLEEKKNPSLSAEENDLAIMEGIQEMVKDAFPNMPSGFIESVVDEFYESKMEE